MKCEDCYTEGDYRDTFDLSDYKITIHLDEIWKHPHTMQFLFEDKVMNMRVKNHTLQLWRDTEDQA